VASGDTLYIWGPDSNEPPSSDYATLDLRNGRLCLDFDASSTESAIFSGVLPQHYGDSGATVYLHTAWSSDTSASHNTRWNVSIERVGEVLDVDGDSFGGVQAVSQAVEQTSGNIDIVSLAFADGTEMDGLAVGEGFRLKVLRAVAHTDDDATGDAEIYWVDMQET